MTKLDESEINKRINDFYDESESKSKISENREIVSNKTNMFKYI